MPSSTEISAGRWAKQVTALFNLLGPGAASHVSPDIVTSIILGNDRDEWAYPQEELLFEQGANIPAAAGFNANMQLVVPAAANILVVIEAVIIASIVGGTFTYGINLNSPAFANLQGSSNRDTRIAGRSAAYIVSWKNSDATSISGVPLRVGANQQVILPGRRVITPTYGFQVSNGTANSDAVITFVTRQRALETSEK
jgi:hypothetical protein